MTKVKGLFTKYFSKAMKFKDDKACERNKCEIVNTFFFQW